MTHFINSLEAYLFLDVVDIQFSFFKKVLIKKNPIEILTEHEVFVDNLKKKMFLNDNVKKLLLAILEILHEINFLK